MSHPDASQSRAGAVFLPGFGARLGKASWAGNASL